MEKKKYSMPLVGVVALIAAATMNAFADDQGEQGPEPLAASFMAQFYDVKPERVTVQMFDVSGQSVAVATVDGHSCEMDMSPAPKGVEARYGWLVGGIRCEARPGSNYHENNSPHGK